MKRLFLIFALCLLGCGSEFCQQGPTLANVPAASYFSTSSPYDAFGVLMRTNSGTIINFYREGTTHTTGGVAIIRTSTNDGTSWSYYSGTRFGSAASCANSGCFFNDATLQVDNVNGGCNSNTGTCILFLQIDDSVHCCSAGALLYFSRSTDNGVTWSTPAVIASYYVPTNQNLVVVPGGSVSSTYPNGAMLEVVLDSAAACYLLASTDDGVSWGNAKAITGCSGTEEVALGYVTANQLMGFKRPLQGTNAGDAPMVLLNTTNMGTTWTSANTNIDVSPKPCCDSNGVPFSGSMTSYQMLSPWLINDNRADGYWTVLFGERQSWNSSIATTFGFTRAIHFIPATAVASPTSFQFGQTLDTRNIDSFVSYGYPSATKTSVSGKYLIQFNAEKAFAQAVQLFTLTGQYACGGTYVCGSVALSGGMTIK